jgi:hypothetical protein
MNNKFILIESLLIEGARGEATDKALWNRAVSAAKKKFDVYPSRYANHWAVNWYNKKGGKWKSPTKKKK